jgi:hypothetical protein
VKIDLKEITVRQVADGYLDNAEEGVVGYSGRLDIRPKYQREFVYDEKKRNAVIDTIRKGFPLNVMYWVLTDQETYEVMDGQQRTISFCQYVNGDFSIPFDGHPMAFHNLSKTLQDQLLDYTLMVYFCSGTDQEKLDWFRIINIAGERLTDQELRNAVYTGPWLSHAKSIFSKTNCAAYLLANKYVTGSPIRQELLETALEWISGDKVDQYMADHQHDPNAAALWAYFQNVIGWVQATFPIYRKEMKGIKWGPLYDQFKDELFDTKELEARVAILMKDDDVTRRKGIYAYVLTGEEKHLSIRQFTDNTKRAAYERQQGRCHNGTHCLSPGNSGGDKVFDISEMEADHITPWSKGGKTDLDNCQMLCLEDNRRKGAL